MYQSKLETLTNYDILLFLQVTRTSHDQIVKVSLDYSYIQPFKNQY